MDALSNELTRIFQGIAKSNQVLIDLCESLRFSPFVHAVVRGFDLRTYETDVMIEGFVDAELTSSKAICAWLEIRWNQDNWIIETRVLVNDDHGQPLYEGFPDRTPSTLDDFLLQLQGATSDLVTFFRGINFEDV